MAFSFTGGLELKKNQRIRTDNVAVIEKPEHIVLAGYDGALENSVADGDGVLKYQRVGYVKDGEDEVPVYSGISGRAELIYGDGGTEAIKIISDGGDGAAELFPCDKAITELSPEEICDILRDRGVYCRGARKYAYKKIQAYGGRAMRFFLNCTESEPGVNSREALILDCPEAVINGAKLLLRALDMRRCEIAADAGSEVYSVLSELTKRDPLFEMKKMKPKFPQDEEAYLIYAVTGTRLSDVRYPERSGCAVFDAETAFAVYNALVLGIPHCERVVSVNGKSLLCPVGTPVGDVLSAAGVDPGQNGEVILGGPLRGRTERALPVIYPDTDAVTVTDVADAIPAMQRCIRCGKCADVCPSRLMPFYLASLSAKKSYARCEEYGVTACTECGCCDYVCPSYVPVKKLIRLAKRRKKTAKATADENSR